MLLRKLIEASRSFLCTHYGVRPTGEEERFLHASASYAADKLDGSRARPNLWVG
ncbi:hypothetical protein SBF1_2660007 [Candidatus Desulfosporosinus infrequens]|uniref:Uncharacterized protein n=1 Tax=Candidatus Desulfosporosinus infrequens TaxID=2043169 RepID=A0A2U3KSM2_9FIRM|nr:hypothetical protein SBF1_2660007 [Candidatus Desulfosporosinus infrequens]